MVRWSKRRQEKGINNQPEVQSIVVTYYLREDMLIFSVLSRKGTIAARGNHRPSKRE